jgi:hypothetical protein
MSWFEAKVKYLKVDEISGKEKKVTEPYLVDAISFTEAETRIIKKMECLILGEFKVTALKISNISEVLPSDADSDDRWYKAKVIVSDVDEASGKERRCNRYFLVAASDMKQSQKALEESLSSYLVPWDIATVTDTPFMDVYPYFEQEK